MSDITLKPIRSGYNLSKINQNFDTLEDVINDEILHTEGGNNTMNQQLDMDSNKVLNLPEPTSDTEPVRRVDLLKYADEANKATLGQHEVRITNLESISKANIGVEEITKFEAGLDIYPLIGQGLLTSSGYIYVVPNLLPDAETALPNPAILDLEPVDGKATINGGQSIILFSVFTSHVGTGLPLACIVKENGYDGTNADTLANLAYALGYGVQLPYGGVNVSTTGVKFPSESVTVGLGDKISGFVATSSFRGNIIESKGFDQLVVDDPFLVADGCPTGVVLRDFYILGNKGDFPDVEIVSNNGYGLRFYGKAPTIKNIRIARIPNIGLHTALGSTGSDPNYNPFADNIEGEITSIYVLDTGYENFIFDGPRDVFMDNIYCGWAANSLNNTTYNPSLTSKFFSGAGVDGVVMRKGAEIGFLHQFDNAQGWGFNYRGNPSLFTRLTASKLFAERNFGNFRFAPNTKYVLTTLISEENMYGDGSRPHIRDESDRGLNCHNAQIQRSNDTNGSCLEVKGFRAHWSGQIISNGAQAGHGVDISGQKCSVDFYTQFNQGVTFSGEQSSGVVIRESADRCKINIVSDQCTYSCDFQGAVGTDYRSTGSIESTNPVSSSFNGIFSITKEQYSRFELLNDSTGNPIERNEFKGSAPADYSLTTVQNIVIPHTLLRTPDKDDVNVSLSYVSGTVPNTEQLVVINTSATTITVHVKFGSGGSGNCDVVVRV